MALLFVTALLLALTGCSGDDPIGPGPIPIPPPPENPDALMGEFEHAYGEMNLDAYDDVLHDDFKFIFIGNIDTWTRIDDMQSTTKMFAGEPGVNPDDTPRDGVQSISMNALIRQTHWQDVPADDPDFPDTQMASYHVIIVFTLEGGNKIIIVDSDQEFYVKAEDVEEKDGSLRTRYFLSGQRDVMTDLRDKGSEDKTWGEMKSLYY